jgi:hypothetical protein
MKKLIRVKSFSSKLVFLFGLTLVLGSCSSKAIRFTGASNKDKLNVEKLAFDYLSIKSKVELTQPNKVTKVTALIRMKQDSLIWFNLSGALGVQGMRGMITMDSVYIINRVEKAYSTYSFADVSREFNFPIDFSIVQSMIIGDMPKPEVKEQYVRRRNKKYVIRQAMDNILIDNYIDETKMKLVELQVRERETENELKLMYKDFRVLNNQAFPYSAFASLIHFNEFGQLETQMNIEHTRVEVPEKELNFPFNIPNKYVRQQ